MGGANPANPNLPNPDLAAIFGGGGTSPTGGGM